MSRVRGSAGKGTFYKEEGFKQKGRGSRSKRRRGVNARERGVRARVISIYIDDESKPKKKKIGVNLEAILPSEATRIPPLLPLNVSIFC